MDNILNLIFTLSWVGLLVSGFVAIIYRARIDLYFKNNYAEIWAKLGKPSLSSTNDEKEDKYMRYLTKKEYLDLNDVELNYLVKIASLSSKVGIFIFIICLISSVYMWVPYFRSM